MKAKRKHIGGRKDIVWVALVACALAVPAAIADEAGTAGLKKDVKKALTQAKKAKKKANRAAKRSRRANQRSANALEVAEETLKQQGPPGPKGDKGDKGDNGEKGDAGAAGADGLIGAPAFTGQLDFSSNNPSFAWPFGPDNDAPTDEAQALSPARIATFTDLLVKVDQPMGPMTEQVTTTVRIDGVDSALSCTIPSQGTVCVSNVEVAVPPGSGISMKVDPVDASPNTLRWRFEVE